MRLVPVSGHGANSCCFHCDTHRIQLAEFFVIPARTVCVCVCESCCSLGVGVTPLVCKSVPLPKETQNLIAVHSTIPGLRFYGPAEVCGTCFQLSLLDVHSVARLVAQALCFLFQCARMLFAPSGAGCRPSPRCRDATEKNCRGMCSERSLQTQRI